MPCPWLVETIAARAGKRLSSLRRKNRTPVDRLRYVWAIGKLTIVVRERDCKANARPAGAGLSEACLPAARNDWG